MNLERVSEDQNVYVGLVTDVVGATITRSVTIMPTGDDDFIDSFEKAINKLWIETRDMLRCMKSRPEDKT